MPAWAANPAMQLELRRSELHPGWPVIARLTIRHEDGAGATGAIVLGQPGKSWGSLLTLTARNSKNEILAMPFALVTQTESNLTLDNTNYGEVIWCLAPGDVAALDLAAYTLSVSLDIPLPIAAPVNWSGSMLSNTATWRLTAEPAPTTATQEAKLSLLALYYMLINNPASALLQVNALLAINPRNIDALDLKSQILVAAGDNTQALEIVDSAIAICRELFPEADPPISLVQRKRELTRLLLVAASQTQPTPTIQFAVASLRVKEDAGLALVTVRLDTPFGLEVRVTPTITGGTAVAGTDYQATLSTLVFAPGEQEKSLAVTLLAKPGFQPACTLTFGLANPQALAIGPQASCTLTIEDSAPPPASVGFAATTAQFNEDAGTVNLGVTLSAACAYEVTVDYSAAPETAVAGVNYALANGSLRFAAGETQQNVSLRILRDGRDSDAKTLSVQLGAPLNAALTAGAATCNVTILNLDPAPSVGFRRHTSYALENAPTAVLAVELSAPSDRTITVNVTVTGGNAVAPADYEVPVSPLTFAPLSRSQPLTIALRDNGIANVNRTLELTLQTPQNTTLRQNYSTHTLTIVDDETYMLITLRSGWNLLALPRAPQITDPQLFFEGRIRGQVWTYTGDHATVPQALATGVGYWVFGVTQDPDGDSFIAAIASQTVTWPHLQRGWNLISPPGACLPPGAPALSTIWHWDAAAGNWVALGAGENLQPGVGYWIYCTADGAVLGTP